MFSLKSYETISSKTVNRNELLTVTLKGGYQTFRNKGDYFLSITC